MKRDMTTKKPAGIEKQPAAERGPRAAGFFTLNRAATEKTAHDINPQRRLLVPHNFKNQPVEDYMVLVFHLRAALHQHFLRFQILAPNHGFTVGVRAWLCVRAFLVVDVVQL